MCGGGGEEDSKQTKSEQTKTKQTSHHELAFNNGGRTEQSKVADDDK